MPNENPEAPRTRTNAPANPPHPTKDAPPRRDPADEKTPARHAGDDPGVGGDRMPKGFDEPGAGL